MLNHALKLDYKNPLIWGLLAKIYTIRAKQASSKDQDKLYSKCVFCLTKAAKYEQMNSIPEELLNSGVQLKLLLGSPII